jgi:ketosteroid isomerase-like protein
MIAMPLEERMALQDLMTDYCYAVDDLKAGNAPLLKLFTQDAVLDLSDIGLAVMHGHDDYKPFYDGVFAGMSHHQHYITNFRVGAYAGDTATLWAYVHGLGRANDGNEVDVHVRYKMDCIKQHGGWKIKTYWIFAGMPMPSSIAEIHAK